MMECPFCHAPYSEGALFCRECGTYLLEDSEHGTDALGSDWLEEEAVLFLSQESDPAVIRLNIGGQGRQVVLRLDQAIHLGRTDPARHIFPHVDLTDDGGPVAGVSRRHAKIFKREAVVVIEDLGSTNGTFVNGKRLAPHAPAALSHGDTLRLGRLIIQVLFEDEEEVFQKGQEPQARQEYIEQRLAYLFELYEGGLTYLEWGSLRKRPRYKIDYSLDWRDAALTAPGGDLDRAIP
jgi:pSer/pThr/pTyr-binding forkhead associated (FHA) protein